jgi:hypothetical protein
LQISRGEQQGGSHWFDGRDFGIGYKNLLTVQTSKVVMLKVQWS